MDDEERLAKLSEALIEGEERGPSTEFDVEAFIQRKLEEKRSGS
jgi:Arc/MetJ-type ribon-helix-helix transcriptional regulator